MRSVTSRAVKASLTLKGSDARMWRSLCIIAAALPPGAAEAGAWTRAAGEAFVSQTTRIFSTEPTSSRDVEFARSSLGVYAEYGALEGLTLGAEADQGFRLDNAGFGQQDGRARGFARVRLWTGEAGDVASVEAGGSIPLSGFTSPAVPGGDTSYEIRVSALYGRGLETPLGFGWADGILSYAKFVGPRADEIKLDLTLGLRPAAGWVAMAQVFATKGLRNANFGGADFDLAKVQLSVGYQITETRTLLLGAARDVLTRGASDGYELSLAVWTQF